VPTKLRREARVDAVGTGSAEQRLHPRFPTTGIMRRPAAVWHERGVLRQIPGVGLILVGSGLVLMA